MRRQTRLKETLMVEVSEKASQMILNFLEGQQGPTSVRLYMAGGG
jgi:hypothetical protein